MLSHCPLHVISKTSLKAACQDDSVLGAFQVFLYTQSCLYLVVMTYNFRVNQC